MHLKKKKMREEQRVPHRGNKRENENGIFALSNKYIVDGNVN